MIQGGSTDWAIKLGALINTDVVDIADNEVFVQTMRGALVLSRGGNSELPDRLRMLLFLINGRRQVHEYRDLLPRYRNLYDAFDMLLKKGLIKRRSDLGY
ncbi:MAG: hypothetical protein Q4A16_00260 [Lautropia sp.]|nr:hypothetical protein [Lautropia sp.]